MLLRCFNRKVGTENWGKAERIDVFHLLAKLQEVHAPPDLSTESPKMPIEDLKGILLTTNYYLL